MAKRRASGEGTYWLNKSDGRWKAQITIDGKRKGKSAKTQQEVRKWLTEQNFKINEGLFIEDDQIRLSELLDRYLRDVAIHQLRPRTYERYSGIIRNHINPALGNVKLNALRAKQIQRFYTKKLDEGASAYSVKYIHAVLHKALNQAVIWELVPRNVTDHVVKPRTKKKTFKTWSAHEVNQFLNAVKDHRFYPIYVLAFYTGMRQGELLGLHREDINLDEGTIHVRHQVSSISGVGLTITEPKSESSIRPITIPKTAIEVLKDQFSWLKGGGLIFKTASGKPISPRNLLRHFKQVI